MQDNISFADRSDTDFYTIIKCGAIVNITILDESELNHLSNAFPSPEEESSDEVSPVN